MDELYPIRHQRMKKVNRVSFDFVAVFKVYLVVIISLQIRKNREGYTVNTADTYFLFFFIIFIRIS